MKYRFYNAYVVTVNDFDEIFESGEVWVENEQITYVGRAKKDAEFLGFEQIDCGGDMLIPGFVNSHAHLPMTVLRGVGDERDFNGWWTENVRPIEVQFTEEDCYWSSLLGIAEMLEGGTTSALSMYFKEAGTIDAFKASKMRGVVAIKIHNMLPLEESEKDFEERFNEVEKGCDLITYFVQSHSIFSTDEPWLNLCTKMAKKHKLPQTIHLAETLGEVGECDKENGMSPVAYLENIGFFDYPTVIAHGVYVDKDDMEILRNNNVQVAINMSSNLKLGSGIAPIKAYQNSKVKLSLATDSASSNNSLDMFKEMYLASVVTKAVLNDASVVQAREVLRMATRGGAQALFIADRVGQLKQGYKADIVRVSVDGLNWQPNNNKISNLVYAATKRDVTMTMVNGKILYNNGKFFLGESIERIKEKCSHIVKRINGGKAIIE